MKDRMITLALAVGAITLFYALFFPKPVMPDKEIARPLSTEVKPDGYQGLWRWLGKENIPEKSLRQHYDQLSKVTNTSEGNLLIATFPQLAPAHLNEWSNLDEWIKNGNTVLVMAALDDTPMWAMTDVHEFQKALKHLTGLDFEVIKADEHKNHGIASSSASSSPTEAAQEALEKLFNPVPDLISPMVQHPLFNEVHSIGAISDLPASTWSAKEKDGSVLLAIGQRINKQQKEAALWLKRNGKGQLIICAFASPFSNRMIGRNDNAHLFANIVAWSVGSRGIVIFDDAHQGLVGYYDAKAFFADPRLHRTLLWIVFLWLLFVLGWQQLRPRQDIWKLVDTTTFIKVTGGYLANTVSSTDVAKRLFVNFFNNIRRRLGLPENGEPAWEWLSVQVSVSTDSVSSLRKLHDYTAAGKRINLVRLQNLLARILGDIE